MIVERCLRYLNELPSLVGEEKRVLFRHMARNYGRTVRVSQSTDSNPNLGSLLIRWSLHGILSLRMFISVLL